MKGKKELQRKRNTNNFNFKLPWFIALGSMITFFSWILENYNLNSINQTISYLETVQMLISIEESHLNDWYLTYIDEINKEIPNNEILIMAAARSAKHQLNILKWASNRIGIDDDNARNFYDKTEHELDIYVSEMNVKSVQSILSIVINIAEDNYSDLINLNNKSYSDLLNKANQLNIIFLWSYIIGTLIIGFGVFSQWRNKN